AEIEEPAVRPIPQGEAVGPAVRAADGLGQVTVRVGRQFRERARPDLHALLTRQLPPANDGLRVTVEPGFVARGTHDRRPRGLRIPRAPSGPPPGPSFQGRGGASAVPHRPALAPAA